MGMRRGAAATALAVALGAFSACGGTAGSGAETSDDWLTSTDPVDTTPLAWATDSAVHLTDGTDVDLGGPVVSYVVAVDGVFFIPAPDDDEDQPPASRVSGAVHLARPGAEPVDTELRLRADTLRASPDGWFIVGDRRRLRTEG